MSREGHELVQTLRNRDLRTARDILTLDPSILRCFGLTPLNDIIPLALHALVESYDLEGITGKEVEHFDFFRTLWELMSEEEKMNVGVLSTYLCAGCKFDPKESVDWILPIVFGETEILDAELGGVDRVYELSKLRHSALHSIARDGNFEMMMESILFESAPVH